MSTTQELSELPAQYDPGSTERAIYERWIEAGVFSADEKRSRRNGGDRDPFVVIMPPPNVTAALHMGTVSTTPCRMLSCAGGAWSATRRFGCRALTTPALPRRTSSRSS